MTHELDISLISRLAQQAIEKNTYGNEFMLQDVHAQTRKAYERFPEDAVIRQVAFTVERMADRAKPGATITQAQVSEIYNNFAHIRQGSKFRSVLGHLLKDDAPQLTSQNPDYTKLNRVDAEDTALNTEDYLDKNMVNALSGVFGESMDNVKAYNIGVASKGVDYVRAELQSLGYAKPDVEVMGGDSDILVYAAHFDTNKGRVTVAIPIHLANNKLVLPSTFVADNKLAELSGPNLQYFVDKKAESNDFSVPNVNNVLGAVGIIVGKNQSTSNETFDKVSDQLGNADSGMHFETPSLYVDRQYQDGKPDLDITPKSEMPKELAHLARDFEDSIIEAASAFGKSAIDSGKRLVLIELATAGFKNAQVKFGSESKQSVVYLATINTPKGPASIEVPVEMQVVGGRHIPLAPALFVHNGHVDDFTGPKLQHFASNLSNESVGATINTNQYKFMVLPELKNEIMAAAGREDYRVCESILQHIASHFSDEDYNNAVCDYQHALVTKSRVESREQHKCAKMIPAGKGSIYPRCGHYGVPMHDVLAGRDGHCMLKSAVKKQELNPVKESGASISSAKVFMA